MITYCGTWVAEENYDVYPKDKWCDLDYVAAWIKDLGYQPKTTIENLVEMIVYSYTDYLVDNNVKFYINMKESENGIMISVEDVRCFVKENGGLSEFDYYS